MKDIPDKYGNLFKSGAKPGLGTGSTKLIDGQPDYKNMSMSEYNALRNTQKEKGEL